nr:MAG TPA: hypothetical protein [Caudoviricetes sp.]
MPPMRRLRPGIRLRPQSRQVRKTSQNLTFGLILMNNLTKSIPPRLLMPKKSLNT